MIGLRRSVVVLVAALAVVGGCSTSSSGSPASDTADAEPSGSITVSAAASLTEPFGQIAADFERANPGASVQYNFDSSSALAKQIEDGAPADVYASADQPNMQALADRGLLAAGPSTFARNRLAIAVKRGNPLGITALADLPAAQTIALCGSDVPCGRYADEVLSRAGVAIPADRITRGQNVKTALAAVSDGDADAAIVYATDGNGKVELVAIPDEQNAVASYPIAVLASTGNRATADAFVQFVLGPAGQASLGAAGFLPP
jgi:molybdate transport system substrate-binding protein